MLSRSLVRFGLNHACFLASIHPSLPWYSHSLVSHVSPKNEETQWILIFISRPKWNEMKWNLGTTPHESYKFHENFMKKTVSLNEIKSLKNKRYSQKQKIRKCLVQNGRECRPVLQFPLSPGPRSWWSTEWPGFWVRITRITLSCTLLQTSSKAPHESTLPFPSTSILVSRQRAFTIRQRQTHTLIWE